MSAIPLPHIGSAIDPALLSQCVHCGLCLDACPTYVQLGTEADSPRGRIHLAAAIEDGSLPLSPHVVRHFDLCLGCRACETACPSGVAYGRILEGVRGRIEATAAGSSRSWADRFRRRLLLEVFPHRKRLRALTGLVRGLQSIGVWWVVERWIPAARLFPPLGRNDRAESSLVAGAARGTVGTIGKVGNVAMLTGCVAEVVQPQVGAAAVRVLHRCGVSVEIPRAQGCCGALHLHAGDLDGARKLARINIDAFADAEIDAVVATAAGCGAAMREYGELLRDDRAYRDAALRFAALVRDVTEYVDGVVDGASAAPHRAAVAAETISVAYHDACHLAHAQGIRDPPRRLLKRIPGLTLVELEESDRCCGSAGSYNLTEPEMAQALASRKVDCVERSAADCIAVANPGCALQIRGELRRRGNEMRVAHPVELLDEWLRRGEGDR